MKKIMITFKDPDGVLECIDDNIKKELSLMKGLSENELEEILELRREKILETLSKWIEWNEYISITFDLEEKTATVFEPK